MATRTAPITITETSGSVSLGPRHISWRLPVTALLVIAVLYIDLHGVAEVLVLISAFVGIALCGLDAHNADKHLYGDIPLR